MKKKIIILLCTIFLVGCGIKNDKNIDYSDYLFTDISWVRNGENDIETLIFRDDGSFAYYCSCGNSVNDSDMCDSYTYNDETKEITFNCFDTTEDMVTNIKIVNMSQDILELDFNGEIRSFKRSE